MTQPRLSIVMCTYNGAIYLQPQLDSLLIQTCLPDEIVISDDGSSDASMDMLQAFAEQARHLGVEIRLLQNAQNIGCVENFSLAMRQASGDVLFLCDQDDVWRIDKLALMAARFSSDPSLLLLHTDARLVDAKGVSLPYSLFDALQMTPEDKQAIHSGRAFEVALRRSFATGATTALRRELVEMALPVAQGWIHDEWLTAVVAASGRMDFIDEALIDYRQHAGNQIGMRKRNLAKKWHDLVRSRGRLLRAEAKRLRRLERFLAKDGSDVGGERAAQVRHKRAHVERRVAIGRLPRCQRVLPILREVRAGLYRTYGVDGRSALRDMLRRG